MGVSTYSCHPKRAKADLSNYFRRLRKNGVTPQEHLQAMTAYSMMLRNEAPDAI